MAIEQLGDELDEELNEEDADKSVGKKSKLRLIIILISVLVLSAGGGAFYFMKIAAPEDTLADGENVEGDGESDEEVEVMDTPYYFSLNPPFVVNFAGKSRAKFLQINIDGLTRVPSVKEDITTHLPHIRNNIVFILSSKRYEDLITPEGKDDLRKQVLKEVRSILKKETGNGDVEDIYFTSFVMQ
ncbi:MAG: flagellar FliL protein [Gammaproteobacteria bacterium]|jgi:flagellar FliL protein